MKAYKLFNVRKDGSIGPLFINRKLRIPMDTWMPAEDHPTKGYAHRPYWHCCAEPDAPHLSPLGRQWYEVEITDFKVMERPVSQGNTWYLAEQLKVLRKYKDRNL